jgi:hypothetical protein
MPNPCDEFKWQDYLDLHPDLTAAGIKTEVDARRHYDRHGSKETQGGKYPKGRRANKDCTSIEYWPAATNPTPTPPTGKKLVVTVNVYDDGSIEQIKP